MTGQTDHAALPRYDVPRRKYEKRLLTVRIHRSGWNAERNLDSAVRRELASRVLSRPQSAALDGYAEADVSVGLRGHERMFSWTQPVLWV